MPSGGNGNGDGAVVNEFLMQCGKGSLHFLKKCYFPRILNGFHGISDLIIDLLFSPRNSGEGNLNMYKKY